MESRNQMDSNGPPKLEADVKTSISRRKLIQRGLVVAPVLLALKSTPVLACNCKLPSGFSTSGNLSRNAGATCSEPAHQPSWWLNHISSGKFGGAVSTSSVFNAKFGVTYETRTFLAILQGGTINLTSLLVSAYIGKKVGYFVSGISIADLKNMAKGTYKPPHSSATWTNLESENYLRYVMGLNLV